MADTLLLAVPPNSLAAGLHQHSEPASLRLTLKPPPSPQPVEPSPQPWKCEPSTARVAAPTVRAPSRASPALESACPAGPLQPIRRLLVRLKRQAAASNGQQEDSSPAAGMPLCQHLQGYDTTLSWQTPSTSEAAHPSVTSPVVDIEQHGAARRQGPLQAVRRGLAAVGRAVVRLGQHLSHHISPQGPGDSDTKLVERVLNVVTCAPFFSVGAAVLRQCTKPLSRRFGTAMVLVGFVASAYHASFGFLRVILRKGDYYLIAASSMVLRQAIWHGSAVVPLQVSGHQPLWCKVVQLASALMIPFKPSLVSTANCMLMEARCAYISATSPCEPAAQLRSHWLPHVALAVVATTCFKIDDLPSVHNSFPYMHSLWHVLAAGSMASTVPLLTAVEKWPVAQHA